MGLMIMHKLNLITVDFTAQMHYFVMRAANFEALYLKALLGKNTKFLCSLDWKFPEFFKTHPTFICSSFLRASDAFKHKRAFFLGDPVYLFLVALKKG